ncbi:kelch-like protein 33, partial [Arapaima gigas]
MELSQRGPLRGMRDLLEMETSDKGGLVQNSRRSEKKEQTVCQGVLYQKGEEKKDEDEGKWTTKEKMIEEEEDREEVAHLLRRHTHPMEIFHTMKQFYDSGLLTDLTLRTSDGGCFLIHFPIMAAVSSVLHQQLQQRDKIRKPQERSDGRGTRDLSISLVPEVERTGLAGVVEFAYTGAIMNLNRHTVAKVRAAAEALGIPRALELCNEEEKVQSRRLSSEGQLETSLQCIRQLWTERLGCDVGLEAEGKSFYGRFSSLEEQCRVYSPKDNLVLVGGDQITPDFNKHLPSRKLWFANTICSQTGLVREIEWRMLGEMPEPPRFSHTVGVLQGNLYIIGGRHYYGTDGTLKSAY